MNKAKQYSKEKYILFFVGTVFTFLFLIIFQIFVSAPIKSIVILWTPNFYLIVILYALLFSVINYWAGFPLHFYETFFIEHKYGLSNQDLLAWTKDEIKKNIISGIIFLLFVLLFYYVLKSTGQYWWLILAFFWMLFTLFFSRIMPTVILPLFYKYSDVDDDQLKADISKLAKESGIKILDIFKINFSLKTKKANAAVIGIGKSRRVILADTLLANFSKQQILSVCAHEFGHHKRAHMPKLIVFSCVSTALSFYLLNVCLDRIVVLCNASSIYDIKIFPSFLLVLYVFSLIMMPIQNWFSRKLEVEADLFALLKTKDIGAFKGVMQKLGEMNLADVDPPKIFKYLFYSHPPISERIAFAEKHEKSS
ncbi:MAG: M48 family metallopeptidase [Candidatus Omnitrophica bacterium]|nr:M48 family metallopeptidase [Candidatus Omnitrophota bacterium]